MINKVTFTGRETMLTNGIEKGINKAHEYVSASKIYPKSVVTSVEKEIAESKFFNTAMDVLTQKPEDRYFGPFAIMSRPSATLEAQTMADNFSYAVAHGKPEQIAEDASRHINFFG